MGLFFTLMFAALAAIFAVLLLAIAKSSSSGCNCSRCRSRFLAGERGVELPNMCPDFASAITDLAEPLTPEDYYRKVWQLVREHFLYSDRLFAWQQWEHAYDGKLQTFSDAGVAVSTMLSSLKDRYSVLHDYRWTSYYSSNPKGGRIATSNMLAGGIGYIKLFTFDAPEVGDRFRQHLASLDGANFIVLDLRGNLGGRISHAIDVLDALVEVETGSEVELFSLAGTEISAYKCTLTSDSILKRGSTLDTRPRKGNLLTGRPLVLIVDHQSASASELVAGSLRRIKGTPLVGGLTFGKGVAQMLWYLDCGTLLRLTTAQVILSDGTCVDGKGLVPDHYAAEKVLLPGDRPLAVARRLVRTLPTVSTAVSNVSDEPSRTSILEPVPNYQD